MRTILVLVSMLLASCAYTPNWPAGCLEPVVAGHRYIEGHMNVCKNIWDDIERDGEGECEYYGMRWCHEPDGHYIAVYNATTGEIDMREITDFLPEGSICNQCHTIKKDNTAELLIEHMYKVWGPKS